ncbi:MAG: mechanosensitive ion channel family protein [Ignavibacteria bacterium]|nr:mechanosensitive ion channel family protein [Ignavibacteria bacterium]
MKQLSFISAKFFIELIVIISIFILGLVLLSFLTRKIKFILREKISLQSLNLLIKIIIYGFVVIYVILSLMYFGVKLEGLIVAGGFLSIIVGLATQKVLGNGIAGIFLIIERPIKLGQSLTIQNISGIVEEIRFLSTVIRSFDGPFVRIPNEQVFNSVIINLMENVARRIDYLIDIRYSDDFSKASKVLKNYLDSETNVLAIPEPEIFVEEFASSSVRVHIRFWTPTEKWYQTKNRLLPFLRDELVKNGIEVPFPQVEVKIHNLSDLKES